MIKKIKLMADYCCFPLWDMETGDNIDPENLPLSVEIREKLAFWAQIYDQILNWNEPILSGFKSVQEKLDFEQNGLILADRLQEELGNDYRIFYFSEINNQVISIFNQG